MKTIEKYYLCPILDGEDCVQPKERWGQCATSEDNGKLAGCSQAKNWIRKKFKELGEGAEVTISADSKDKRTLFGKSGRFEYYVSGGVGDDLPNVDFDYSEAE